MTRPNLEHLRVVAQQAQHAQRGPMADRAARLWPDSPRNQREWLRAVALVRKTSRGWVADCRQPDAAA